MNWLGVIVKSFFELIGTIFKWSVILILLALIILALLYGGDSLTIVTV
jgi:hypothetical protein